MHVLTCLAQHGQGKDEEGQTEQEVADVAVLLLINQDDADEESRIGQVAHVERHTCRHNPSRQRRTDVGTHNHRDGLCQRQQTGIDKRHRHHRGSRRRLHTGCHQRTCQHTRKAIGGHGSEDVSQLRTRHLLQRFTHRFHTEHQQCQRAQQRENNPD